MRASKSRGATGSSSVEELPGIHDAIGILRALQPAHRLDLLRPAEACTPASTALLGLCHTFRPGVHAVRVSHAQRVSSFEIPLRSTTLLTDVGWSTPEHLLGLQPKVRVLEVFVLHPVEAAQVAELRGAEARGRSLDAAVDLIDPERPPVDSPRPTSPRPGVRPSRSGRTAFLAW